MMDSKRKGCLLFLLSLGIVLTYVLATSNINDLALRTLSYIKNLSNKQVPIEDLKGKSVYPFEHDLWDRLLKRNVSEDGKVNYKGFLEERDSLDLYLQLVSNNPPDQWWEEALLAYWINAYNAFTIELILQHYPIKSIKDIAGGIPMINSPWDIKFFKIGGIDFDLNTIEHDILRKQFNQPNIHFAINCASVSCPNLLNEAYTPNKVKRQMLDRLLYFMGNPLKNRITDEKAELSQIFNWFEPDFTKEGTLTEFINLYNGDKIREGMSIEFLEYDWRLNE